MAAKTANKLTAAAAYIRMSTGKQQDSPERQRMQIEEYAKRSGFRIVKWYSDHGMTGTESRKRLGYQQLLADVPSGMFSALIVSEQSRMSREDLFSIFPQWGVFRDAGVKLISCQSGEIDFGSLGGILQAMVNQYGAHDESRKIADRTVSGKVNQTLKGNRVGGMIVFGYDRQILDSQGRVLKQVGFRERFKGSSDTHSVLVPSADTKAVDALRWAFDHVKGGGSIGQVVKEFNRRGIRTALGKPFNPTSMKVVLTNPVYCGVTRTGIYCSGKFRKMTDTHAPVTIENTHPAIIDRATFDAVAGLITSRSVKRDTWRTYLLSGLCRCGHCGRPMNAITNAVKHDPNGVTKYGCPWVHGIRGDKCPVRPAFDAVLLERAVIKAWCDAFLCDETVEQLRTKPATEQPAIEHEQLKAVRAQIERAERNLALADGAEEFQVIRNVLKSLQREEAALLEKIGRYTRKRMELPPDLAGAVGKLKKMRKHLEKWPDVGTPEQRDAMLRELAFILKSTISNITLRADDETPVENYGGRTFRRRTGVVTFNPEHVSDDPVTLTDEMLAHPWRRQYRKVHAFLQAAGRPMATAEITEAMQLKDKKSVLRALNLCRAEGRVKQLGDGLSSVWTA